MVTLNWYTIDIDPGTADPPPPFPPAGENDDDYVISVTITCSVSFAATWTQTPPEMPDLRDRRTILVPRRQFFADAPAAVSSWFSAMGLVLPDDTSIYSVAGQSCTILRKAIDKNPNPNPNPTVLALSLGIRGVCHVASAGDLEQLLADRAAGNRPVPAARSAAELLETVKGTRDVDECMVCLEELNDEDEDNERIVRMPCSHIYHLDCIGRWLMENHKCPLCRYSMPTN